MGAWSDTYDELHGNITDLRGEQIPIHQRRVDDESGEGQRRGARYDRPYVTIDAVGLDPGHTVNADIWQVVISIYSRPSQKEAEHDMLQVKDTLERARCSVRRDIFLPTIDDYAGQDVSLPYVVSTIVIARKVARNA